MANPLTVQDKLTQTIMRLEDLPLTHISLFEISNCLDKINKVINETVYLRGRFPQEPDYTGDWK